ncbi:DUF2851 family protein [Oleiharenicola sp. Vm1]|uniref:DUF2851 family protein n=1 Tax=Oleiharenicola sp. Vm1 TaxID=3398393 RepID=UPI0039F455ED
MASPELSVAEMQGLYGPFTMHERVVQKIWLQQDFAGAKAALADGRALEIVSPGRWNLLGGPDFRHARLRVDGREVCGDVEVHFHAQDWTAHGHAENPAYDGVVLHVLLFPPPPGARTQRRRDGAEIPALVLLPLLHRDLEEYAADDALEVLTARDEWRRLEALANLPLAELRARLQERAERRWRTKVASARQRVAKLGFEGAAHHAALEILGYRHNRVPMLAAAERWPLAAWRDGLAADAALAAVTGWQHHGVRPANHPRARLAQYRQWTARVPNWPQRLMGWGEALPVLALLPDVTTAYVRRAGSSGAGANACFARWWRRPSPGRGWTRCCATAFCPCSRRRRCAREGRSSGSIGSVAICPMPSGAACGNWR